MRKRTLALAAALVVSITAPAVAADYRPPPPPVQPAPVAQPLTCIDRVNQHYGSVLHRILLAPAYLTHATLCHLSGRHYMAEY